MTGRLPSALLVSALLRRVNDSGGFGVVRARGESAGGAIMVIVTENGSNAKVLERGLGADGRIGLISWVPLQVDDHEQVDNYWQRRRRNDPDLWVIELDTPFGERFAAETMLGD